MPFPTGFDEQHPPNTYIPPTPTFRTRLRVKVVAHPARQIKNGRDAMANRSRRARQVLNK